MKSSIYYKPKTLESGQLRKAVERSFEHVLGPTAKTMVSHTHWLGDGVSDIVELDTSSLDSITDLAKVEISIFSSTPGRSWENKHARVSLANSSFGVSLTAGDDDSVKVMHAIVIALALEVASLPTPPPNPLIEINRRLHAVEKALQEESKALRCFISFKFDDADLSVKVERLKRFLAAAGVTSITGEQYEPRRIEDKVMTRLRADIDFVVAVISTVGQSMWLRDEMTDANARKLRIILLLEEGATFDKGILGSLEYIPYKHSLDTTFLQLLEGINFIKAENMAQAKQE